MAKKVVHRYSSKRLESREVPASAFKNSCLQLIDRVRQTREEIVVTRYGHPVARRVAFENGTAQLFGHLASSVTIHSDVVAPVEAEWNVDA